MSLSCNLCPHNCRADRSRAKGFCGCFELPRIARIGLHRFEEPPISGSRGSGAVFFSGCNMRCVFCQNTPLRNSEFGEEFDADKLSSAFLKLQDIGAHNINLVTPTPHIPVIVAALESAKGKGLSIPIVYNTNAYMTIDALKMLDGLIDIYLPDFKYKSPVLSQSFSGVSDYFDVAFKAITEMLRQVGALAVNDANLAESGVLIRHLVLPNCVFDTREVLKEISERFGSNAYVSLMRQYTPRPDSKPPLNRRITDREYQRCIDCCSDLGLENVFIQEKDSASFAFTPKFSQTVVIEE